MGILVSPLFTSIFCEQHTVYTNEDFTFSTDYTFYTTMAKQRRNEDPHKYLRRFGFAPDQDYQKLKHLFRGSLHSTISIGSVTVS